MNTKNEIDVINYPRDNDVIYIYNPDDTLLTKCDNELLFLHIRLQIAKLYLSGYYFMFNNVRYNINPNGYIQDYPKGLYRNRLNMLVNLLRLKSSTGKN